MTFLEAWNHVSRIKNESHDSAVNAIITGQNVSETFWDNFIMVCNNKDGMAALLNVSAEKIASWPNAIQEKLDQAKDIPGKEKTNILNTGEKNVDEL